MWQYFCYEPSVDRSSCQVPDCGSSLKGKNATNMLTHLKSKHKNIAEEIAAAEQQRKLKDKTSGNQQHLSDMVRNMTSLCM